MEYIGDRISVVKKEDEISIVILASIDKKKLNLLFFWLIAWTVCGLLVIGQSFSLTDESLKAYLIGWLAFWAYFEYKIGKAYLWRKSGMEKIKLKDKMLFYKREIAGKGKVHVYQYDFIKDLRLIVSSNNFINTVNSSYWVISGERIEFQYYGKPVRFGLQLSDKDAKGLLHLIQRELKSA